MQTKKKPLKFYLGIFALSTVIILGYSLYMLLTDRAEATELVSLWFMPLVFTGIYYISDLIIYKIGSRRGKTNEQADFLEMISAKLRENGGFLIEDFRKLQLNPKFQESLKIAFQIWKNGENDLWTIAKLEKRFRSQTLEAKAMEIVTGTLREPKGK